MSISVDTEKAFDKIQHPIIIKTFSKLGLEGTLLSLIRTSTKNLQLTSHLLKSEKREASHTRTRTKLTNHKKFQERALLKELLVVTDMKIGH